MEHKEKLIEVFEKIVAEICLSSMIEEKRSRIGELCKSAITGIRKVKNESNIAELFLDASIGNSHLFQIQLIIYALPLPKFEDGTVKLNGGMNHKDDALPYYVNKGESVIPEKMQSLKEMLKGKELKNLRKGK